MLSSHKTHYAWSKQDRESDIPFFRAMAREWHPTVHRHETEPGPVVVKSQPTAPEGDDTAAGWTPWQLVE